MEPENDTVSPIPLWTLIFMWKYILDALVFVLTRGEAVCVQFDLVDHF